MKKALITGITGQDGSYLAELLLSKGYEVHNAHEREEWGKDWYTPEQCTPLDLEKIKNSDVEFRIAKFFSIILTNIPVNYV